jgi:hypothetical protein
MAKPPHPSQKALAPNSVEQPGIICHNREFYVRELPEDYPYQLETPSESSTNITIPFYEFRGKGPPPTDIGNPGDVYIETGADAFALYAKMRTGWKTWDPLPTWGGIFPPASEFLAHPDLENLNRFFWCDGYQLGWYALSGVRGKRSRMRQEGMYRTMGGLAEEHNSNAVASEVIRRMLESLDTGKVKAMGRSRKRSSTSQKGIETIPMRKKAKISTPRAPNIKTLSKTDVPKDKPLSWKIKFTPCHNSPTPSSARHSSVSITPGLSEGRASALPLEVDEIDAQDVEDITETQRIKDLIEEKKLYEEENQRLKERVVQLTEQTNRLRDEISKCSSVDRSTSSDSLQANSISRSASTEGLNPIIISSADILKTVGFGA